VGKAIPFKTTFTGDELDAVAGGDFFWKFDTGVDIVDGEKVWYATSNSSFNGDIHLNFDLRDKKIKGRYLIIKYCNNVSWSSYIPVNIAVSTTQEQTTYKYAAKDSNGNPLYKAIVRHNSYVDIHNSLRTEIIGYIDETVVATTITDSAVAQAAGLELITDDNGDLVPYERELKTGGTVSLMQDSMWDLMVVDLVALMGDGVVINDEYGKESYTYVPYDPEKDITYLSVQIFTDVEFNPLSLFECAYVGLSDNLDEVKSVLCADGGDAQYCDHGILTPDGNECAVCGKEIDAE
jgi:hypothetical protein